ncbi:uncharacterized protein LOC118192445 [Stegodyphus dumicola]|uniref:uncharacterized protein LOC118192445 n=1 Tax=Stegodyphus dumicola TaxID=202533 RepID=UPI0015A89575|nr:uncharacterized protein LOC118192445 [Stegodyphus dumicola]
MNESVSEDAQSGEKNVRILAYSTIKANGENGIKGKELNPEESSNSSAASVEGKAMTKTKFKQKRMIKRLETRCKNIQLMVQGSYYIHLLLLLMVIGSAIFGIANSPPQTEWSIPCFYQHFLPY